jgi:MarR family transcriptional regulator, multiple antibiotic resistance protein MarR
MKSDDRLIYQLSIAQRTLRDYTHAALSKLEVKLTMAQAGILFLLKQKDMRNMSELGKIVDVDNSAVTRLIDYLEKYGLVERQVAPDNRRAILIHITPKGIEAIDNAKKIVRSINEEVKKGFTPEEIETYQKVLKGILEKFKQK